MVQHWVLKQVYTLLYNHTDGEYHPVKHYFTTDTCWNNTARIVNDLNMLGIIPWCFQQWGTSLAILLARKVVKHLLKAGCVAWGMICTGWNRTAGFAKWMVFSTYMILFTQQTP